MARYMKAPLDLTVEQLNIYTLLYKKADFTSWEADYTFEQLVTDSHKKLGITKRIAMRIIDDFIKLGYIEVIRKGTRGNNSVYRILTDNIFTEERTESVPNPYQISTESVPNGIVIPTPTEEQSTESVPNPYQISTVSVPPIIKTETEKEKIINEQINLFFEKAWSMYPNKLGKGKVSAKTKKEVYKLGDQFITAMNRYIDSKEDWKKWQNGSTFFNSGYIDYLDNPNEPVKPEKKQMTQEEVILAYMKGMNQ